MIGLLIAAFENLTGRAKDKGKMEEDAKGNDLRANGNVERRKGEAKELSEKMKD